MENIRVVDNIVREAEDLISEFYPDEDTSFVFTADHGMSTIGNHGDGRTYPSASLDLDQFTLFSKRQPQTQITLERLSLHGAVVYAALLPTPNHHHMMFIPNLGDLGIYSDGMWNKQRLQLSWLLLLVLIGL
jgi:hypothetical protein